MNTKTEQVGEGTKVYDEEMRDILIAVSVMAKRLAVKMEKQQLEEKLKEMY